MSEYLSMETAPRDGTSILVWADEPISKWMIVYWRYDLGFPWVIDGSMEALGHLMPVCWQPLPAPPREKEQ